LYAGVVSQYSLVSLRRLRVSTHECTARGRISTDTPTHVCARGLREAHACGHTGNTRMLTHFSVSISQFN
jgi:hypothetical protein